MSSVITFLFYFQNNQLLFVENASSRPKVMLLTDNVDLISPSFQTHKS